MDTGKRPFFSFPFSSYIWVVVVGGEGYSSKNKNDCWLMLIRLTYGVIKEGKRSIKAVPVSNRD